MISTKEADVLLHASRTGCYVTAEASVLEMAAAGLLFDHGPQALAAGDHYLVMTTKGRAALNEWKAAQPPPPKPKRRRQSPAFECWRNYVDACEHVPFPIFLREIYPERERYGSWRGGL